MNNMSQNDEDSDEDSVVFYTSDQYLSDYDSESESLDSDSHDEVAKLIGKKLKELEIDKPAGRVPQPKSSDPNWLSVLPDDVLVMIYQKSLNDEIKLVHPQNLISRYKSYLKQLENRKCDQMAFHALKSLHQYQLDYLPANEILYQLLGMNGFDVGQVNNWWQYESTYESRALFYISLAIKLSECRYHKSTRTLNLLKQALGDETCWFSQDLNKRLCGSETYIGSGFQQVQDVCNCVC